jgi:2-oxoisovalerate dehydrogenase E1 component
MLLSRRLDDKEIQLKGQSQIFFRSAAPDTRRCSWRPGHVLRPAYDWFFPVLPRSRALPSSRHDAARACCSRRRRRRRSEFRRPADAVALGTHRLNIVSGSSPTGTQVLHAVGRRGSRRHLQPSCRRFPDRAAALPADEITYVSLGEGATSEGEFWEAPQYRLHQASAGALPRRDNGYAISVPVEVQTPGGGHLAASVRSFPGSPRRLDRRHRFLRPACGANARGTTAYCAHAQGPAFVHARFIRPYSHSLSDDEKLYKPPASSKPRRAGIRLRGSPSS